MTSVVIAAHNESAVIGECITTLLADAREGEFDVTVVANGCSDDTAAVAASYAGVRVIDLSEASKSAALNAGDQVALGFPRIYLDADIMATTATARALRDSLTQPSARLGVMPLAAVPSRRLELSGRPLLVRSYFAISSRLPAFSTGLFGRGMIALSAEARSRFDRFPGMIADDLFLDSLYSTNEKVQLDEVSTVVETPLHTRDLLRRLVRVRRGNAQMRAAAQAGTVAVEVRPSDRWSWLRDVVVPHPWLAPAGVVYVVITALAARGAKRAPQKGNEWGRDASTRTGPAAPASAVPLPRSEKREPHG